MKNIVLCNNFTLALSSVQIDLKFLPTFHGHDSILYLSTEYEISSNSDMIVSNNMSGCVSLFHQVFMLPVSLIF